MEELEEEETAQDQEDVFDLDPFDAVVGQEGGDSDSDSDDSDDEGDNLSDISSNAGGDIDDIGDNQDIHTNVQNIQDMVKKLDSILTLIFDHFHRTHVVASTPSTTTITATTLPPLPPFSTTSRSSSPAPVPTMSDSIESLPSTPSPLTLERGRSLRRSQFHTLLSIFDRTIIRTFKSRYTQFLIFWYASLDPEFSDLFQGMLVSKALLEPDQPAVTRAAAASYIASFVSRAQFVDRESARRVVAVLCEFLRNHLEVYEAMAQSGAALPSVAHHTVFYAVSQAVFLIFCFRWRDLLEDTEEDEGDELIGAAKPGKKWMGALDIIQRVITSSLNPLKVRLTIDLFGLLADTSENL